MKEEVKIDWSGATDNQLSELYDALYERNAHLSKALDFISFRVNIGDRMEKRETFLNDILAVSNDLANSVIDEVKKRHIQKSKNTFSEFSCARPGGPDDAHPDIITDEISKLQS